MRIGMVFTASRVCARGLQILLLLHAALECRDHLEGLLDFLGSQGLAKMLMGLPICFLTAAPTVPHLHQQAHDLEQRFETAMCSKM